MIVEKENNKHSKDAWLQFKKNRMAFYSYTVLIFLMILALIAPFIATDMPWYCKYKGVHMFPAFSFSKTYEIVDPQNGQLERIQCDVADWKRMHTEKIIFAPIAYSPSKSDYDNSDY